MDELDAVDPLATPEAKAAIAAGQYGQVIRIARRANGLKQDELGARIGYSQAAVSLLESGRREASTATRRVIAEVLGIPLPALGLPGRLFTAPREPHTLSVREANLKRQVFLRGLFAAAAALAFPGVLTEEAPRVNPEDVDECRGTLGRLLELDSQVGGGHVQELNGHMIAGVRRLVDKGTYSAGTGRGLREVLAGCLENAGWLAYDAGQHDKAHRHWLEALHAADIGGHPTVRTVALASMSLHASSLRRGNEAVQLAQAASGDSDTTPRVRSLLAAREALGEAVRGDEVASRRAFALAEKLVGSGQSSDDPAWVSFWGPGDLGSHQVQAAIALRNFPLAERLARETMTAPECDRWSRNRALYGVRLGSLLVRRRAVDEAISVLSPAVGAVGEISSGRVVADLRAAVAGVARHRSYEPARTFSAWAGRMLATA